MKIQGNKMIWLLAAAFILLSAFRADKPVVTIFMIGDSTMANKKMDGGNPERDRKSTRLNSSHTQKSRMPSSA